MTVRVLAVFMYSCLVKLLLLIHYQYHSSKLNMGLIKLRGKLNVGLGNFGDYFVFLVICHHFVF